MRINSPRARIKENQDHDQEKGKQPCGRSINRKHITLHFLYYRKVIIWSNFFDYTNKVPILHPITQTSQPHPSAGEFAPPPFGGGCPLAFKTRFREFLKRRSLPELVYITALLLSKFNTSNFANSSSLPNRICLRKIARD